MSFTRLFLYTLGLSLVLLICHNVFIPLIFYTFFFFVVLLVCQMIFQTLKEHQLLRPQSLNRSRNRATEDRQGNIYTVSDDNRLNSNPPHFPDFFYLEPGSEEEARIRARVEKDDKDLPSYDEVMRMTIAASAASASSDMAAGVTASTTSIATATTDISAPPAPPYTQININATSTVEASASASAMTMTATTPSQTTISLSEEPSTISAATEAAMQPSTSRAAASIEVANMPVAPLSKTTTMTV